MITNEMAKINIISLYCTAIFISFDPNNLIDNVKAPSVEQVISDLHLLLLYPHEDESLLHHLYHLPEVVEVTDRQTEMDQIKHTELMYESGERELVQIDVQIERGKVLLDLFPKYSVQGVGLIVFIPRSMGDFIDLLLFLQLERVHGQLRIDIFVILVVSSRGKQLSPSLISTSRIISLWLPHSLNHWLRNSFDLIDNIDLFGRLHLSYQSIFFYLYFWLDQIDVKGNFWTQLELNLILRAFDYLFFRPPSLFYTILFKTNIQLFITNLTAQLQQLLLISSIFLFNLSVYYLMRLLLFNQGHFNHWNFRLLCYNHVFIQLLLIFAFTQLLAL